MARKAAVKGKNYFDNKVIENRLLIWQDKFNEFDKNVLEKTLTPKQTFTIKNELVKEEFELVIEIKKIVKAIIMLYHFWKFDEYEDLEQVGIMNCWQNFRKFKKDKGTAFNFFSLISKKSLLAYTIKGKNRRLSEIQGGIKIEDVLNIRRIYFPKTQVNFDNFLNDLRLNILDIIDNSEENIDKIRVKTEITTIFIEFLLYNGYFKKKEFYNYMKEKYSHIKLKDAREFVTLINLFAKEILYNLEDSDEKSYTLTNVVKQHE